MISEVACRYLTTYILFRLWTKTKGKDYTVLMGYVSAVDCRVVG